MRLHSGALLELVRVEGRNKSLTPGVVFPTPPEPVRADLLLWQVDVNVRSGSDLVLER